MLIKGIVHNVLNDAPFIGALVVAPYCHKGCKGCQNEHLKSEPNYNINVKDIIYLVKENILNEGVILGGLEWTYTPDAMAELINVSLDEGLKVMLYTYMTEDEFKNKFPSLYKLPIWVKFGEYDYNKGTNNRRDFGINLATSNQYIRKLGG